MASGPGTLGGLEGEVGARGGRRRGRLEPRRHGDTEAGEEQTDAEGAFSVPLCLCGDSFFSSITVRRGAAGAEPSRIREIPAVSPPKSVEGFAIRGFLVYTCVGVPGTDRPAPIRGEPRRASSHLCNRMTTMATERQ